MDILSRLLASHVDHSLIRNLGSIPNPHSTVFSDWGNILYNTTIATAIADRLVETSLREGNSKPNPPVAVLWWSAGPTCGR